ncbi:unnamed protein product [Rodentolepis nana]|uniref:DUF4190 domain-containing protein n=1 Tax=Rodentolepis nana TaxID=102285 RepID=A0A0R3T504_RODNA|nr:unnamed protein product [Rodentolepis nana]
MGLRDCLQVIAEGHSAMCKIFSVFLLLLSIGLIIGGSVLVHMNKKGVYGGEPTADEARHYAGGLALLILGFLVFFASILSCCCAFQLNIVGRIFER